MRTNHLLWPLILILSLFTVPSSAQTDPDDNADPGFGNISTSICGIKKYIRTLGLELNSTQLSEVASILSDVNNTKSDIRTNLVDWAQAQGGNIGEQVNEILANISQVRADITAQYDAAAQDLSSDAQEAYGTLKAILRNDGISPLEECQEIDNAVSSLSETVVNELSSTIGLPACSIARSGRGGSSRGRGRRGANRRGGGNRNDSTNPTDVSAV